MESESQVQTTSLLARQPSGIRALPSHDDDDDDDFETYPDFENNNSPERMTKNDKNSNNLNNDSSSKSSNSSTTSSSTSGNNGSFVSGEEEFETPIDDPDEETLEKPIGVAQNDAPASGSSMGSPGIWARKAGLPVAKVSVDGDDDVDENEVVSGEEDDGEVVGEIGRSYTLENAPRVRVSGEEEVDEDRDESLEMTGVDVDGTVGSDVEKGTLSSKIEENASLNSTTIDSRAVDLANEGDAVVDSINVDVGEALRSGVAVVGVEERQDSKVESKDVVAHSQVKVTNEETSVVDQSASVDSGAGEAVGVKFTDEGDSVVQSINVDVGEAVRSGAAVVSSVEERNDSGYSGVEVENSVDEESAQVDSKPVEAEETKITGEEGTVVDGLKVDVVEVVRSGVAVVGDSGAERMETEAKEGIPLGENVTLANEFEPLLSSNSSKIVDVSGEQHKEALANEAETPRSIEVLEQPNRLEIKPETDYESRQHEPADGAQLVSGGEQERVQPDQVDDEPQANSALVEGKTISDRSYASVLLDGLDGAASNKVHEHDTVQQTKTPSPEIGVEAEDGKHVPHEEHEDGGPGTHGEGNLVFSESDNSSRKFMEELESHGHSEMIGGQIVTDSEEEADSDEEGEGKELFDSAALAALLKAASSAGSDSGTITITSQDGSRLFSVERPAGLGSSLRSVRPATSASNSSLFTPPSNVAAPSEESLSEEEKKKLQSVHQLRVKFLRLVQRVGQTAENSLAAQVLYKLALLTGRPTSPAFSLDNAKQTAMQLEAEGKDDLDFSLNILVLGKTGVGKSATINSILGEEVVKINAFEPETTTVKEVSGVVDGVKIRVIDAPGLKSSATEQGFNRKVLALVKRFTKKYPLDVVLYVDRLDSQTRDLNDLPMLRTITNSLGSSIWRSAILTLTHAACAPPDGPSGTPLSYEVFVGQRSHIVQQSIGQAVGDLRFMNLSMMNPVSLVENHPACRKNREGQKVLPNGQTWRPQLLLLCYSLKILAEASSMSKPQDPVDHRKLFGFRVRSPPLPYLLSSLLQPRAHPKLSADQGGDNGDSDIDLDDLSDSDQEEEDEYDQLPPFKPLRKSQIAKLSREQRKAYFDEYDYRVKLLQKKQWREELKRMKDMKNGKSSFNEYGEMPDEQDADGGAPAAVPVPLPDMVLPPSFDSDNPAYRYRFLEPTSQFLARPVLDTHGWDHDCGYDGVNVEQNLGIAGRFPAAVTVQVTKDKKDFNIHLDSAVSSKHGETGSSLLGFDIQTIGKQLAYIVRGESKFKNLKKNKTGAGVSVTFLGENVTTGLKLEDQITLGKRVVLVGSTGTVRFQKDAAYGANIELRLREADYPIGQDQSSIVLSLMKWRGDLAVGANLQSQLSLGRGSKMAVRVSLNNKQSGQITVRTSSSDHLALAYAGLIPIALAIYKKLRPNVSEGYSIY